MTQQLISCIPNFSEGRNQSIIKQIARSIEAVDGVTLLDIHSGKDLNRTVTTFIGTPRSVIEAAINGARTAVKLIDMRQHIGKHPRFGSMDVCPIVPVSNITMDETVSYSKQLAKRLGEELGLTIYCYERSATTPDSQNLANLRFGGYEALQKKLQTSEWKPDFGPNEFNAQSGATAVGARNVLVAYNINLDTQSSRSAHAIAAVLREKGHKKRQGKPISGQTLKDTKENEDWISGKLRCVKGAGWFIKEYGIAQVSFNLTDLTVTPVHVVFDECMKAAEKIGIKVVGSEIVGLVPLRAMLEAGRHSVSNNQWPTSKSEKELIEIAVKYLKLNDLYPFKSKEKIIEYSIANCYSKSDLER